MLPLAASAGLSTVPILRITVDPNVISYDVVPAAEATNGGGQNGDGLVASLSNSTPSVRANQAAVLIASVANVSSKLQLLWNPPCDWSFSIASSATHKANDLVPIQCDGDIYSLPIERLAPGTAAVLRFKFKSPELAVPGIYTINLKSISWYRDGAMTNDPETLRIASNAVSIVVR